MQAVLIPKRLSEFSVEHNCLVKIMGNDPPFKEGEKPRTEICLTTVTSGKHVYDGFYHVSIVTGLIDQAAEVVRIMERNRGISGPVGLVRKGIILSLQPTKNGKYETFAYTDAFFFRPQDEDKLRDLEVINLADMAQDTRRRANALVNEFPEGYKFIGA